MEEKASIEAEVPYVFQTNNMCLIIGCTVGIEGKLLNIVQQFEKDEEEGAMVCTEVMCQESQAQTQCLGEERGKTQGN